MKVWISTLSPENTGLTLDSERTLLKHLPLVRFLAQRIHCGLPKTVDIDDLCSAGMIGLIEAHANFDPTKNIQFASFASFRIRGAILDSLRRLDWAPRTLRRKDKSNQKAILALTSRFGQSPSQEQIALELNTPLKTYQKMLADLDGLHLGTLHRDSEDGHNEEEVISAPGRLEDDPLFCCMQSETKLRLTEAIGNLSERQRLVVNLYYYEELSLREIGEMMELDANRTAYIRASALIALRTALSALAPRSTVKPAPILLRRREALPVRLAPKAAA